LTQTNSWKSQKPSWKQQSRIPPACRNQSAKLCSTSSRKGSQSIAVCAVTANGNASRLVHREHVTDVSIGFCLSPVHIGKRLPVSIEHFEAAWHLLDCPRWLEAASLWQLLIGSRRATTHERFYLRRRQLSVFVGIHRLEDFGVSGLELL